MGDVYSEGRLCVPVDGRRDRPEDEEDRGPAQGRAGPGRAEREGDRDRLDGRRAGEERGPVRRGPDRAIADFSGHICIQYGSALDLSWENWAFRPPALR